MIAQQPSRQLIKAGNRVIGEISDSTLFKRVSGSRHMLKRPPAWAWDAYALQQALAVGAVSVAVFDTETGILYTVPLAYFLKYGTPFNYGWGDQIYLPLGQWQTVQTSGNGR